MLYCIMSINAKLRKALLTIPYKWRDQSIMTHRLIALEKKGYIESRQNGYQLQIRRLNRLAFFKNE